MFVWDRKTRNYQIDPHLLLGIQAHCTESLSRLDISISLSKLVEEELLAWQGFPSNWSERVSAAEAGGIDCAADWDWLDRTRCVARCVTRVMMICFHVTSYFLWQELFTLQYQAPQDVQALPIQKIFENQFHCVKINYSKEWRVQVFQISPKSFCQHRGWDSLGEPFPSEWSWQFPKSYCENRPNKWWLVSKAITIQPPPTNGKNWPGHYRSGQYRRHLLYHNDNNNNKQ